MPAIGEKAGLRGEAANRQDIEHGIRGRGGERGRGVGFAGRLRPGKPGFAGELRSGKGSGFQN
jgi:hypothetical protein